MEIPFNLSNDNYMTFIQQVRNWGKDPNRFSHGRPVLPLPPPTLQQSQYADLVLRARDNNNIERVTIARIRRHDLYIIGYQMEVPNQWLEFKWKDPSLKLIPNSQSLGFGENYDKLGGLGNLKKVGYTTLKEVITNLAVTQDSNTRKIALRALAVMIPEAVRFEKLCNVIAPIMKDKRDIEFDYKFPELITSWGPLSDMLLREDNWAIYFRLPKDQNKQPNVLTREWNIVTSADAASCIALLKGNYPAKPKLLLVHGIITTNTNTDIQGKGLALVEVFSVRINDVIGDIYGTVQIVDGLGSFTIYNRQRNDSEPIQYNEIATLTGPYRGTSASQYFTMSLDLKKKGNNPSSDVEVSKGSFSWDICELINDGYYDKRVSYVVNGKNGSAVVYCTPFRDAVQANVEVVLINGDDEDPADVYGTLAARYSNYDYSTGDEKKYYQTLLFNKPDKEKNVKVKPGNPIPLSRSVVAVPTSGSLIVEANLWDHDTVSSDDEIAKGTAEFPPQLNGKATKDIKGKYGLIRVIVTWNPQITA